MISILLPSCHTTEKGAQRRSPGDGESCEQWGPKAEIHGPNAATGTTSRQRVNTEYDQPTLRGELRGVKP